MATIQTYNGLNWKTYAGDPSNLWDQYSVDFSAFDQWVWTANGTVSQTVNIGDRNATATGMVIDNTGNSSGVTVNVAGLVENIPPFQKSTLALGGSSPYVRMTGTGSALVTFYKGVFPGAIVGQNNVAATKAAIGVFLPPGMIMMWGAKAGTVPDGWLPCEGQAISRVGYAALFNAIGTSFGAGDGTSTFNVPDMRGRFPRGYDDGAGVDNGRVFGSYQGDAIASHQHREPLYFNGTNYGFVVDANGVPLFGQETTAFGTTNMQTTQVGSKVVGAFSYTEGVPYNYGGVVNLTETRPKNIALMFIIKT